MIDNLRVALRSVVATDLMVFFEQARDPVALHQAAFTADDSNDAVAFVAHWTRLLASRGVTIRTVCAGEQVAGHVAAFRRCGRLELGCWLGRPYWGQGIATAAVAALLSIVPDRPIYGRTACDNVASIHVLERSGFALLAKERVFANGRGAELDELLFYRGRSTGGQRPRRRS